MRGTLAIGLAILAIAFLALSAACQDADTLAGASAPPAPAVTWGWTSSTWTQYLQKQGTDRRPIFGARIAGWMDYKRCRTGFHVDASALPDGGAREGIVSFEDPHSFDALELYGVAGCNVAKPLGVYALLGIGFDVEGGRVRIFEDAPKTAGVLVRVAFGPARVYAGAGIHEAAGEGIKGLFRVEVRLKGPASLTSDGAIGGPLGFVRYGVSLRLGGSG